MWHPCQPYPHGPYLFSSSDVTGGSLTYELCPNHHSQQPLETHASPWHLLASRVLRAHRHLTLSWDVPFCKYFLSQSTGICALLCELDALFKTLSFPSQSFDVRGTLVPIAYGENSLGSPICGLRPALLLLERTHPRTWNPIHFQRFS